MGTKESRMKWEPTGMPPPDRAAAVVNKPALCSSAPAHSLDVNLPGKMMLCRVRLGKNFPPHPLHLNKHGFQIWDTLAVAYLKSRRWRLIAYRVWTGDTHPPLLCLVSSFHIDLKSEPFFQLLHSLCLSPFATGLGEESQSTFRYTTRWLPR